MVDLLELAAEYRASGLMCKTALREIKLELQGKRLREEEIIELRRRITLLTAMARECLATSNYLKSYFERRQRLEGHREETGI